MSYKDIKSGDGLALDEREVDELFSDFEMRKDDIIGAAFYYGAAAAMLFPNIPEGAETHGMDALSYLENATQAARLNVTIGYLEKTEGASVISKRVRIEVEDL